jgi:hypothetical protein
MFLPNLFSNGPQSNRARSTMINTWRIGKLLPRLVCEVAKVLSKEDLPSFMSTLASLEYILQTSKEYGANGSTPDVSWGVSTAVEVDSVPASVKETMMQACLRIPRTQQLATKLRDNRFFHSIFINHMCDDDAAQQQRQVSSAQHHWHTDEAGKWPLFMLVYMVSTLLSTVPLCQPWKLEEQFLCRVQMTDIFVEPVEASLRCRSRGPLPPTIPRPTVFIYFQAILFPTQSTRSIPEPLGIP